MVTLTRAYVAVYEAGLVESKLKELEARLDAKANATSNRQRRAARPSKPGPSHR